MHVYSMTDVLGDFSAAKSNRKLGEKISVAVYITGIITKRL